MTPYRFRIPASTSNLGAGFDSLSLALNRYLYVSVESAAESSVEARGVDVACIPSGPDNIILHVARTVAIRRGRPIPHCRLGIENEIPLARGLGSSATAIIAGITAYEFLADDRLTDDEIFQHALEFEPHPDNLAASLYGGLLCAATSSSGRVVVARLSVASGAAPLIVIPEFELSTEKAREVLPHNYSRADAVFNIQRSALTIAALTAGKWSLLCEAMRDRIHQPYRAALIPGLDEILNLQLQGLFGIALSGAGPAVFAFTEPGRADDIGREISSIFSRYGVASTPIELDFDLKGRVSSASS